MDETCHIMKALQVCYLKLKDSSKASPMDSIQIKGILNNKIFHLCQALGRHVKEQEAIDYRE